MFRFDESLKVYLYRKPVDFGLSINGLAMLVEQALGLDRFIWPSLEAVPALSAKQLHWLLEGIDIAVVQGHAYLRYCDMDGIR